MTYVSDWRTYQASRELLDDDTPFYALVMAAMRRADTFNAASLRQAFPDVWDDLQARYDAPAGLRASDADEVKRHALGLADGEPIPEGIAARLV